MTLTYFAIPWSTPPLLEVAVRCSNWFQMSGAPTWIWSQGKQVATLKIGLNREFYGKSSVFLQKAALSGASCWSVSPAAKSALNLLQYQLTVFCHTLPLHTKTNEMVKTLYDFCMTPYQWHSEKCTAWVQGIHPTSRRDKGSRCDVLRCFPPNQP